MNIKSKLATGIMSATLGLALIAGGTYAYFSDSVETQNTFAAGTLDLSVAPTEIVNVDNIKPGDSFNRNFELTNGGTLDIGKVLLETDYTANGVQGNGDFGEHIQVEFLYNMDNYDEIIFETTLAELKEMTPEAVNKNIFYPELGDEGLPVGETHDLIVKFNFIDNEEDQNQFQGASLNLTWTFNAQQKAGEQR